MMKIRNVVPGFGSPSCFPRGVCVSLPIHTTGESPHRHSSVILSLRRCPGSLSKPGWFSPRRRFPREPGFGCPPPPSSPSTPAACGAWPLLSGVWPWVSCSLWLGAFGRRLPVRPGGQFEGAPGAAARGLHQGAFTDQAPHRLHRGRAAAAALGLPPVLFTGSLSFLPPLPASC